MVVGLENNRREVPSRMHRSFNTSHWKEFESDIVGLYYLSRSKVTDENMDSEKYINVLDETCGQ